MKKKAIALVLLAVMLLSLAACGEKAPAPAPAASAAPAPAASAAPAPAETPFVEEEPAKNELDAANPIPGINREFALTEQVFAEENLRLLLPAGVTAVNEGRSKNQGHITVTDEADGWKLLFRPYNFGGSNLVNNVDSTVIYADNPIKTDWSRDVAGTLAGFPVRVWANNIRQGWLHPSNEQDAPAVDILMDYGETLVGEWLGLYVRLEALDPKDDTNIYHYLYNSTLRAVLNSFEPIRTADGEAYTANGITVSVPARWPVKVGESSIVIQMQSNAMSGGITLSTQYNPDPQHHADRYEGGEQFKRTYGDNDWIGVIAPHVFEKDGGETTTLYSMYLFSEFNDKMSADVHVNSNSWSPADYRAFLDNDQFVTLMESVKLDPAGWHQPGTAEVNGLLSDGGNIKSYSGSAAEVEIPSAIGGYNTVSIGVNAFKDNTSIKKVIIPEGVTEIQPNAFSGCTNLETVVLPDTLNFIYQNAFRDCPKLKDVTLPDGVVYVGFAAYCGSGTGTFRGSAAEYDSQAFAESGFDTILLAPGTDISGDYMFSGAALSEIQLPDGLTAIGKGAFTNCHNIQRITLPDSVTTIGESAFASMFGLPYINLPEGITEIPDNCFNSTTLDTLVIPASVTRIGDSATYGAAIIVIENPEAQIGRHAIQADYIYLADAARHVFSSDYEEMVGSCLYLDGIYDPSQIQGDFYAGTAISSQVYLPSDATYDESDALDRFLLSIGYDDIAWIGAARDFLPDGTFDFEVTNTVVTGFHGDSTKLAIPHFHLYRDDDWWLTENIYRIDDEAFKGASITEAYFRGQCGDGIGSRILDGDTALTDIWFNYLILDEIDGTNSTSGIPYYQADSFAGIPENVTVHLPASFTDAERAAVEASLHAHGIPAGASFDYYSLRG